MGMARRIGICERMKAKWWRRGVRENQQQQQQQLGSLVDHESCREQLLFQQWRIGGLWGQLPHQVGLLASYLRMQVHISPNMRRITISTTPVFLDPMKMKLGAARYLSYRCLFWTMLLLVFLLPFTFITSAVVTLEGANKCSSIGMLILLHLIPRPPTTLIAFCRILSVRIVLLSERFSV